MDEPVLRQKNPPRPHRLCAAVALALGAMLAVPASKAAVVVPLSSLNGGNGFRIDGASEEDFSGTALSSAGDINGDGIDDFMIGARSSRANGVYSGSTYVVFGTDKLFSNGFE